MRRNLFFFLLPHTSLAAEKKSISEVRKKQKTKQTHTSHVDSKRHSWKRVQVAMYKSVARRMKPRRALLAPVSACLGVTQQFSRWRGTGRGGVALEDVQTPSRQSYKVTRPKNKKHRREHLQMTGHVRERPSQRRKAERLEWQSLSITSWHVAKVMFLIEQWILTAFCADGEWTHDVEREHKRRVSLPPFIMLDLALRGRRV